MSLDYDTIRNAYSSSTKSQISCQAREGNSDAHAGIAVIYNLAVVNCHICEVAVVQHYRTCHSVRLCNGRSICQLASVNLVIKVDFHIAALSGNIFCRNLFTVQVIGNCHINRKLFSRSSLVVDVRTVGLPCHLISVLCELLVS